ncbi:MAG: nuclear transport factor 2 family protein [Hyphomonadaceae bacterium]
MRLQDHIVSRYISCYNERDIEGLMACVTEDVIFENISNSGQNMRLDGRDAMGEVARLSINAFSYRRQKIISFIDGGDKASAEVQFEGKAAVDLPNGTKAGEMLTLLGASFFEIRSGLLCRIADYS